MPINGGGSGGQIDQQYWAPTRNIIGKITTPKMMGQMGVFAHAFNPSKDEAEAGVYLIEVDASLVYAISSK